VVLTCTVKPHTDIAVARINPEIRLNDYVESITKWHALSTKLNFRMLVLENSNSIEMLKMRLPESILNGVTFHQCPTDSESRKKGISSGEFIMLRESMSVLKEMGGIEFCWKVTGRLFVNNFAKLTKSAKREMWVNRFYKPRHITDTRFFGIPFTMYSEVFSKDIDFAPTKYSDETFVLGSREFPTMEDFLTRICLELEIIGWEVQSFYQIPIFEGVSASTGKKLDRWDVKTRLKIANMFRKLAVKMISGSLP
jgi:hypothetical protein